jgi:hypothetical protein
MRFRHQFADLGRGLLDRPHLVVQVEDLAAARSSRGRFADQVFAALYDECFHGQASRQRRGDDR